MSERESLASLELWEGGFPGGHEFSTLEEMDQGPHSSPELGLVFDAAQTLVNNWQGNHFAGLYLYGQPGNGKTHAAIGVGRQLHAAGAEVHYRYSPGLTNMHKSISEWAGQRANKFDGTAFPGKHVGNATRNPRSALILDDYKPDQQPHAMVAIEAAAQYGGLVIITSNHPDPFRLVEKPADTDPEDMIARVFESQLDPDDHKTRQEARKQREAEVSASLRSRIANGFKFIEFTGSDRRENFWDS